MWFALMRLNGRYRREAGALDLATSATGGPSADQETASYPRHRIVVLVDQLDLAAVRAIRSARSLRRGHLYAAHIVIDPARAAALQRSWVERGLAETVPLRLVDCPDRRLVRAAVELAHGLSRQTAPR